VDSNGGFAELHFFPNGQNGRMAFSALYNRVSSDDPLARYESASLTFNWLMARNVRLMCEVGRDLEADRSIANVGVVTAF
jgi:hypothetical protein